MPVPLIPLVAAVVAAAAAAAAAAHRGAQARASKSIVLIGASASGKTSLARAMSDEPYSLESGPTNSSKTYTWRTTGTRRIIHLTDMPGADAHRAWQQHIRQVKPDLVCLLVDYARVITDDEAYRDAETLAAVARDIAPKRPRALVLTHTDLVEETAGAPELAVQNNRSRLLVHKLMPKKTTGGTLAHAEGARSLGQKVISWLE